MEDFLQVVADLLQKHFPGSQLEIERASGDRVGGFLIWGGFSGVEQIERQRAVWKVLRQSLSASDQLRVAAILTLTPEEMAMARAG
jgi:acid stress-induced BolA-like protein IbaG/YrbA